MAGARIVLEIEIQDRLRVAPPRRLRHVRVDRQLMMPRMRALVDETADHRIDPDILLIPLQGMIEIHVDIAAFEVVLGRRLEIGHAIELQRNRRGCRIPCTRFH